MAGSFCKSIERVEANLVSLLDNAFEDFKIIDKTSQDDGYGGYVTVWVEGATIKGAMVYSTSTQSRLAQALGVTSSYVFTTKKNISLEYHDVIKRVRDGKIFRITSDGDDSYTPDSAGLDMRQVTAEEWKLSG